MIFASIFRNRFIFSGYLFSVNLRKVMISAVYEKVNKLSMKSITETNSGKLITIVSGDIQSVERAMAIAPIVLAAPFINIVAYIAIWLTSGPEYALVTFIIWVIILILQTLASN
jgi:ABC-type transport system involved in cytochrome bd biosynthesis fused ATPase/permease subunit